MMRIVRYLAITLLSISLILGLSRTFYYELAIADILPDDYQYGDLYRFTNLASFKAIRQICSEKLAAHSPKIPVALYAIGDSFMEPGSVDAADFPVQQYAYTHWNDQDSIQLNPSLKNVLLIESVERHFREHLEKDITNIIVSDHSVKPIDRKTHSYWEDFKTFFTGPTAIRQVLPEERLDNILFNWPFTLKLREWKAELTLKLFNRIHPMTSLSTDGHYLLLNLDTDSTLINSNFNPVSEEEINHMVNFLNDSYERYHQQGFEEIYLSIIPNKTTIVAPNMGRYNHLIERIQANKRLKMKVIDAYSIIKPLGSAAYQPGDSHWTCDTRDRWLRAVNALLPN
ncbi:MAG: hypothetical protein QM669_05440 [Siphonobacter sp.]